MNLNCEIVMDLIALYQDGLASPSTKTAVAAHLAHCPSCSREYALYRKYCKNPTRIRNIPSEYAPKENFSLLANRLRHRRMLLRIGMISYVCASFCMMLLMARMKNRLI